MKKRMESHGFDLEYVQELPELKAVLYRAKYKKNGAELVWLDRKEENKTFAIAFKTIPSDDTGVFHILEHSLLCGSEKYPVSKPFVELMKSSLQTFMNAFTFPDKTMYPVCSRNQQDFLNLIDVYLDAVFHPLCTTKRDIFWQEGWHYEMEQPDDELRCNGVVYNEMKGMYASPDTIIESEMNRLLFPDNCYQFQSGGDPAHITELTYENYVANYRRFYHPSNARIVLDGDMELDSVLAKLDTVLKEYDNWEVDNSIPFQKPVSPKERVCYYEVANQGEVKEKAILAEGWVYGSFNEPEKNVACSILSEALCSSNESPLKKAILEKGLAENVEFAKVDGMQQAYLNLVVRNTSAEKKEQVWDTVWKTLQELSEKGLDHKRLEAILNRMEFRMREKESGGFPEGVINAMNMLDSWLYGGDPAQNLCMNQIFSAIRNKIEEGYFEQLIREVLLENPHHARLTLLPSVTLGEEKRVKEVARFQKIKESWSEAHKRQVVKEFAYLRKLQETPDSSEQLATLPVLSLRDIPEKQKEIPQTVIDIAGNSVLLQQLETDGITHLTYYFLLEDMSLEELSSISFLRVLLGQTETEHYGVLELQAELEGKLGRFETSVHVFAEPEQTEKCKPYLAVYVSVLKDREMEALQLIDEVLNTSRFHDIQYVRSRIRQIRLSMEQHVLMSGNVYATQCVAAGFSAKGAVWEVLQGIQMLRWVQRIDDNFEEEGEQLLQNLEQLYRRIFIRERVTLNAIGDISEAGLRQFLHVLPNRAKCVAGAKNYEPLPIEKKGILIPAEIGFAGKGGNLKICNTKYHGSMKVAARILSYGYLWNTIRVKGGAYGTGAVFSEDGDIVFTTFRDPNPLNSLASFDEAGNALRSLSESGESLERYIISTIATTEPLLSTRQKGIRAAKDYFNGITDEMRQKMRSEILHTSKEELAWIADVLDSICKNAGVCVIAGKSILSASGKEFTRIENL